MSGLPGNSFPLSFCLYSPSQDGLLTHCCSHKELHAVPNSATTQTTRIQLPSLLPESTFHRQTHPLPSLNVLLPPTLQTAAPKILSKDPVMTLVKCELPNGGQPPLLYAGVFRPEPYISKRFTAIRTKETPVLRPMNL